MFHTCFDKARTCVVPNVTYSELRATHENLENERLIRWCDQVSLTIIVGNNFIAGLSILTQAIVGVVGIGRRTVNMTDDASTETMSLFSFDSERLSPPPSPEHSVGDQDLALVPAPVSAPVTVDLSDAGDLHRGRAAAKAKAKAKAAVKARAKAVIRPKAKAKAGAFRDHTIFDAYSRLVADAITSPAPYQPRQFRLELFDNNAAVMSFQGFDGDTTVQKVELPMWETLPKFCEDFIDVKDRYQAARSCQRQNRNICTASSTSSMPGFFALFGRNCGQLWNIRLTTNFSIQSFCHWSVEFVNWEIMIEATIWY